MSSNSAEAPPYVVRAAAPGDLEDFKQLRERAGPGFTSLMVTDAALAEKLDISAASFAASPAMPSAERYLLALEHVESGRVVGCCQVKATIGAAPPFFNFRILQIAQASAAAQRRYDMGVLILVNEFTGCTEVGSLFLRAEHRAGGVGRALAQSRYMLIGAAPHRFNERVVSEMRGVVTADGQSPFWEALGAHFFRMSFAEADHLSATTDNQFILDLMPKYPIYADLLPQAAREVIGKCHAEGEAARRLLEWEGFRHDHVVDIFDGGPLLSAARDAIRTTRETRRVKVTPDAAGKGAQRALLAQPAVAKFRCAPVRARLDGEAAHVHPAALAALGLEAGEEALIWANDAP
jgi:arginine N-succinyltransferase